MTAALIIALLAVPPEVLWTAFPDRAFLGVASPGDVNGNGTQDLVVCPDYEYTSGLYCADGLTGEILWENETVPGVENRLCISGVPDIDGDGIGDLAVGTGPGTDSLSASVLAVSGGDGEVIWATDAYHSAYATAYTQADSGGVPVIHATTGYSGTFYFLALDGANGDTIWVEYGLGTQDEEIFRTSDFSGNGWEEMGYVIDRGTVFNGQCVMRDGLTGGTVYMTYNCYDARMDVCDTPPDFMMVVGHWGLEHELFMKSMTTGDTVYALNGPHVETQNLRFAHDVTGGHLDFPVVMGWDKRDMKLLSGMNGTHGIEPYTFPYVIKDVTAFQATDTTWKMAVLTSLGFHVAEPEIHDPDPGPDCSLPTSGNDLCMIQSDAYATPLAGVALTGSGPGLCAITTSEEVGVEERPRRPAGSHLRLLRNPGMGGISLEVSRTSPHAVVLDVTGRRVAEIEPADNERVFLELPPGVYLIVDDRKGSLLARAVVLPAR
ncbi:hypothetical protein GF402_06755 [Candidatus Fermentibacteria bacterium]|nr:hypothetical protein [Candidatus Fermentibacteria bacterium]